MDEFFNGLQEFFTDFPVIAALIVGGIIGWVASSIWGEKRSTIGNIVIGIIGAGLGNWLVPDIEAWYFIPAYFIKAVIGASILIFILNIVERD